jgi:hypothetical protein
LRPIEDRETGEALLHGILLGCCNLESDLWRVTRAIRSEEERTMSMDLSLAEIIANLEAQMVFHRAQAALHGQQEEHHREQRVVHEAELQKVTGHWEALKAAAPAADLVRSVAAPSVRQEAAPVALSLSRMVARVLEGLQDGEPFGQTRVTAEVNRRFRESLSQPADPRTVSATLRRLAQKRRIHLVEPGRPRHEALYAKGPA